MNVSGAAALPNHDNGIYLVNGTSATLVGGTLPGAGNVISGNLDYGIYISDPGTSNNVIQGNLIGTDVTGTSALGNGSIGIGVWTDASSNLIGGTVAGAGNVISGNTDYGIASGGANGTVIQGNLIGTDLTGTNALGNDSGVGIFGAATGNLVGGSSSAARNVISGNGTYGLFISDPNTSGNFVAGNLIGTDISGRKALANGFAGVSVFGAASGNFIGGTTTGTANLISGNVTYGVFISDTNTSGNQVQGNVIGADLTGTNALGNFDNVELQNGATGNVIGGVSAGAGNLIAFATGTGVILYDAGTTGNSIRGNSIFNNGFLGIDLNGDGVTLNHAGFLAGPDDLQNFPVITNAVSSGGSTIIQGTLNSTASRSFLVDVYASPLADSSGYGEGQVYLGTVSVTTDGAGTAGFIFTATGDLAGQFVTTTATDAGSGDTSEFSQAFLTASGPAAPFFAAPLNLARTGFVATAALSIGQSYRIQATTNFHAWVDLTNFTASATNFLFLDPAATNYPYRFYRIASP